MILWKDSVDGPVQTYKLNTVTYGTTCAPYLATRTIQQLARDEGEHYPLAASVTIRDIYMDILTGEVLSIIARLFDPLGFLWPILTKAKLILQKLWVLKLEWDEPLTNPIAKEWTDFVSTLLVTQNIHVPRLVIGKGIIIIHGFADASTAAYGAVLCAQSISEEDVSTRLLCSKSRVAPVKPITIPRLELCACVLLSQLLEKVLHSLTLPIQQIMLWTDSNIVLAWIQRSPEQLQTFIGNRIKIIQRLTQNCQWNHVSSNENPANLISRGLNASDISSKQLWWHGPDFLREELEANPIDFERITSDSDYLKELKPANVLLTSCKFSLIDDLSKRSNNYTKLLHVLSYIFRFLHNSRNPSVKRSGQLDYREVNEEELCLIKNLQVSAFQEEIEFLAKTSKAVHLEIVSDLTTDAFLATLKRFVARRRKCATISSDNAKNIVGTNRELKRLHNLLKFPGEKLSSYLSSEGISWNFMPPRAPNFGGLWEAGVKSFKFYLKRAIGNP
ncbi:uncharacterized protein TNCV_755871 [Trichonephila clavipes]|nr:uncharacterized protein TNCV_755871 [Trichonephila clavipes]